MFSPKLLKSLPKTIVHKNVRFQADTNVFHKFSLLDHFWPNDNLDVIFFLRFFLSKLLKSLPKTIFHKNVRFQAETNAFHKFALLDHFWPNDNLHVVTFLRFFLQTAQITAKNHFSQKRTFSGWKERFPQISIVLSFLTKWYSWCNYFFTIFSPKLLKSLPKTIFHKNVRFQAETIVSTNLHC